MRDVIRYSEAFKLRLAEDVVSGKYKSLNEAGRRNGISGCATLRKRIKQYGREDMLPKRIKVETVNGIDELGRPARGYGNWRRRLPIRTWTIVLRARFWISRANGW
jgi:transposase-like protein